MIFIRFLNIFIISFILLLAKNLQIPIKGLVVFAAAKSVVKSRCPESPPYYRPFWLQKVNNA